MKKLLLLLLAVSSSIALADATIAIENYTADKPLVFLFCPITGELNVEVLGGPVGGIQASIGGAFKAVDGYFDNGVSIIPGVADNAQASFTLRAWEKGAEYPGTGIAGEFRWMQNTGSWDPNAIPPAPPTGPPLMPQSLVLVCWPEPSTTVLGLMGAAILFYFRRK